MVGQNPRHSSHPISEIHGLIRVTRQALLTVEGELELDSESADRRQSSDAQESLYVNLRVGRPGASSPLEAVFILHDGSQMITSRGFPPH